MLQRGGAHSAISSTCTMYIILLCTMLVKHITVKQNKISDWYNYNSLVNSLVGAVLLRVHVFIRNALQERVRKLVKLVVVVDYDSI